MAPHQSNDFPDNHPDRNAMRLFTREEANALLPEVKRLFERIDRSRATLRRLSPEAKRASESEGGGGIAHGFQYADALATFIASAQGILNLVIGIKDLDHRLAEFPHEQYLKAIYRD